MRMLGFVGGVIAVYLGLQYYLAFWLIRNFPGLGLRPALARVIVLALAAGFPLSLYLLRHVQNAWTVALAYASCIWLGAVFIMVFWAAVGDIALLAARLAGAAPAVRPWLARGAAGLAALSILWAAANAARMPRVHELEVELRGLPAALDGFTVVQLSDIHVGLSLSRERFARIVERASALEPDLLVLTGDILDAGLDGSEEIIRIGAGLKARRGVFAVLGNHEFYHGARDSERVFAAMGARPLRGEIAALPGGLQVAGVDDIRTAGVTREELARLFSRLDPARPSLLLSHQPLDFEPAAAAGVGLMLSGHTHGGQIFPFGLAVRLFYSHLRGLYRSGESWLYVSPGTGHWGPPMRWGSRAEITRIRLRASQRPEDQARRTRPAASGS